MLDDVSVAVAHKDYAVAGGGEVLAEQLGLALDAPVYAGYVNDENRPRHLRADVRDLFGDRGLSSWLIKRGGVTRQFVYRHLWKRASELRDYDVVIQSGMEPLWYQPRDNQTTVAYLHSTPRVQYDLYPYLHDEPDDLREWVGGLVAGAYNSKVRRDTAVQAAYPDLWVCNSDLVERRLQRYYGVDESDTAVVYPPVPTDELGPENTVDSYSDAYLSLNRLDDWKRIDEVIDAFADLDERLLVAGKGPAGDDLREQAEGHENIEFLGFVSEEEKRELLASVKALVYNPLNEDFGMVPVEAVASGTPVVTVRDGFQRYQLTDGENAVMYDRELGDPSATTRALKRAVARFKSEGVSCTENEMAEWAEQFGVERFRWQMRLMIKRAVNSSAVQTSITKPGDKND